MRNIEEKIRQIRVVMAKEPESDIRAAISELHRIDAMRTVGKVSVAVQEPVKGPWDALITTKAGQALVQAKCDASGVADRIRQLKELVHDTFVVMPRTAEPVNGWVPRVRFDLYQRSKEACRKIGQEGGARYDKAITTMRYAMTSSKAYREAIEVLGL